MRRTLSLSIILAVTAPLFAPRSAEAIIRRHDIDDSNYVVSAEDYPALVDLLALGDCMATLIHPLWLITAAHCAVEMPTSASLMIGGVWYPVATVRIPSHWDDDVDDIALIELVEPVADVAPILVYEGNEEVGQVVWFVGRGDTSTGLRGQSDASVDGRTRRASNTIVAADNHWIRFVFNSPEEAGVTPLEGISGDGDSGGPALLVTDEETWIVGLSSFQDEGNFSLGRYGVEEFYTRVSQYRAWLEAHMGGSSEDFITGGEEAADEDVSEVGEGLQGVSGANEVGGRTDETGCTAAASEQILVWLLFLIPLYRQRWS